MFDRRHFIASGAAGAAAKVTVPLARSMLCGVTSSPHTQALTSPVPSMELSSVNTVADPSVWKAFFR